METKKDKNLIGRMWGLLLVVAIALLGLYYLPERIEEWELKPIDMLSDLRTTTDELIDEDAALEALPRTDVGPTPKPLLQRQRASKKTSGDKVPTSETKEAHLGEAYISSISPEEQERRDEAYHRTIAKAGIDTDSTFIAIEDYTAGRRALSKFFGSLLDREKLGRPVRIAVLGDSFIEGDIFTDPLRKALQSQYGGSGVGWMPLSSQTAGFRPSVRHEFSDWSDHSVLNKSKALQTFVGHYFSPKGTSWVRYTMPKGTSFSNATLYYTASSDVPISLSTGDTIRYEHTLTASMSITATKLHDKPARTLRMDIRSEGNNNLRLYGLALEGSDGISVDNMSLRGSSGINIAGIDVEQTQAFCSVRPYDLIVLQYGLNVAASKQTDYSHYIKQMKRAIERLRSVCPNADILILSVSERAQRRADGIKTMPGVIALHQAQQRLAQEMGVAFWSIMRAMRAQGGIAKLASNGRAAKDYTHLTHRGGIDIAKQLVKALTIEKTYYETIQ